MNADPDDVLRHEGTAGTAIVAIGVKNVGDATASETVLNVVFPAGTRIRWCGPRGEPEEGGEQVTPTEETITMLDGSESRAEYLRKSCPRVGRRSHLEAYVAVMFPIASASCPLRIKAEADETPDDCPEYRIDYTIGFEPR